MFGENRDDASLHPFMWLKQVLQSPLSSHLSEQVIQFLATSSSIVLEEDPRDREEDF